MYHIGQRFTNGNHYILAHIGDGDVTLINLNTGIMWSNPFQVQDVGEITECEIKEIFDGDEFDLISDES